MDRDDILNLYVVTTLPLPSGAEPAVTACGETTRRSRSRRNPNQTSEGSPAPGIAFVSSVVAAPRLLWRRHCSGPPSPTSDDRNATRAMATGVVGRTIATLGRGWRAVSALTVASRLASAGRHECCGKKGVVGEERRGLVFRPTRPCGRDRRHLVRDDCRLLHRHRTTDAAGSDRTPPLLGHSGPPGVSDRLRSPRIRIDALVRSGGMRRRWRPAGRARASNVACRGLTPDPEGNRSITEELLLNPKVQLDRRHQGPPLGSPAGSLGSSVAAMDAAFGSRLPKSFHTTPTRLTRKALLSQNIQICRQFARALCRTRTDDPFLTMEGRGCFERSQTRTSGHEMPANR